MTIKQQGGVFGRHPSFADVTADQINVNGAVIAAGAGSFGDDVDINGDIILANGKGIDFSATAGTGTSELFDDYEEGTWTPTTAGDATGALSSALGFYTKIGNFVTVTGYIDVSTNFTSPNVGGLPYTVTQKFGATSVQSAGLVLPGSADTAAIIALPLSTTDTVRFRLGGNSVSHNPNTSRNTYVFSLSYYV